MFTFMLGCTLVAQPSYQDIFSRGDMIMAVTPPSEDIALERTGHKACGFMVKALYVKEKPYLLVKVNMVNPGDWQDDDFLWSAEHIKEQLLWDTNFKAKDLTYPIIFLGDNAILKSMLYTKGRAGDLQEGNAFNLVWGRPKGRAKSKDNVSSKDNVPVRNLFPFSEEKILSEGKEYMSGSQYDFTWKVYVLFTRKYNSEERERAHAVVRFTQDKAWDKPSIDLAAKSICQQLLDFGLYSPQNFSVRMLFASSKAPQEPLWRVVYENGRRVRLNQVKK